MGVVCIDLFELMYWLVDLSDVDSGVCWVLYLVIKVVSEDFSNEI